MKKHIFKLSLLSTALCLTLNPALAEQTQELEGIDVVAGSMYRMGEVPVYQAKSAVAITREQLDQQGVSKTDEIGRYQAGFSNQVFGEDTNTNWFRVRGAEVTQAIDGLPLFSYGFFTPYTNTFAFEAIEVTKGADAMTFGAAQSGGLLNYVTKRPHKEQIGKGEFKLNMGNNTQYGFAADYTGAMNSDQSLRYRVVSSYGAKDGQWEGTKNSTFYFAPSVEWDISDRTRLTLLTSYQFDKGIPSSNFLPQEGTLVAFPNGEYISRSTNLGDPINDREYNRQYNIGYELNHQFTDNLSFSSSYRYSYVNNFHRGSYAYPSAYNADWSPLAPSAVGYMLTRGVVFNDGTSTSHNVDNHLNWTYSNEWLQNTLVVGSDYRYQKVKGLYTLYGQTPAVNLLNPLLSYGQAQDVSSAPHTNITARQLGLYLQNQSRLFDTLVLNLGIRHDRAKQDEYTSTQSVKNNHTSYSASLMYEMPFGLNPYISYSESFNLPTGLGGDKKLYDPNITHQYEAGIKYLPNWLDGSITVAAFKAKDKGALVSNDVGATVSNKDPVYRKGVEVQADINIVNNWNMALAYTYLKSVTRTTTGDIRNPLIPKHTLAMRTDYSFAKGMLNGLTIGAGVRYIGKSVTSNGSLYSGKEVPSATVVDLMARYQFTPNWSTQINIDNVGNRRYVAGCDYYCYYGAGRNINASISYKF
ncbi:CirA protein [Gallibacterium salpingitidis]|uniref:CirA protein n=2 Tax=Gallibacterium salpingitidis TaxID=505341 RepID=A0AB36E3V6_9PAST|nr:TonB-dependent siderophore receptor [Gallibacterium salpingitidis]OBX08043.1 CirA protein [Gallibacterium salpingitidis]OBX11255.1 CirA protein [Gallibacterium salpingitidis]